MVSTGRRALLLATSQYTDASLTQLRSPTHDVAALSDVLRDPRIGDFDVATLVNMGKPEIEETIEGFFKEAESEDTLLFFVSCHGIRDPSGSLYFAVKATTVTRILSTAVSAEFLKRAMSLSRCRRVIVLVDCCYSGAFSPGFVSRGDTNVEADLGEMSGRGQVVIASSGAFEYAFEGDEVREVNPRPSLFTGAVVAGLRSGEADLDQDGYVSVEDLYSFVYAAVREQTPNQTPTLFNQGKQGTLYVAYSRGGPGILRRPSWNPLDGRCRNVPSRPALEGPWQISAPRDSTPTTAPGTDEAVEIGLRKYGGPLERPLPVTATVYAPDEAISSADRILTGADWLFIRYPDDFDPTSDLTAGVHTVVWSTGEGFLAADGFIVSNEVTPDTGLSEFEAAWLDLRKHVFDMAVPDAHESAEVLIAAVDRAVAARVAARKALADLYSSVWVGDQALFVSESRVGANSRLLDEFCPVWLAREGDPEPGSLLESLAQLMTLPSGEANHDA
jgi:uncharacterized caspase-like protein